MPDPFTPGWRPEYTGDTSYGDIGSGEALGLDLYELYRAGRVQFPDASAKYAVLANRVHHLASGMSNLFNGSGGTHEAHHLLMALRAELQDVLRQTSINIEETGSALVAIADAYAATDQAAADALASEIDNERDLFQEPPPAPPERPAPVGPRLPESLDPR